MAILSLFAGILPLFSECPGAAEYCVIAEHFLGQFWLPLFRSLCKDEFTLTTLHPVPKPVSLSHVDCASGLGSGLRAYTAFHTQAAIVPGNVVLITGAASVILSDYFKIGAFFKFEICHRLMEL